MRLASAEKPHLMQLILDTVETEISVQIFSVERLLATASFGGDCDSYSARQPTLQSDQ